MDENQKRVYGSLFKGLNMEENRKMIEDNRINQFIQQKIEELNEVQVKYIFGTTHRTPNEILFGIFYRQLAEKTLLQFGEKCIDLVLKDLKNYSFEEILRAIDPLKFNPNLSLLTIMQQFRNEDKAKIEEKNKVLRLKQIHTRLFELIHDKSPKAELEKDQLFKEYWSQ